MSDDQELSLAESVRRQVELERSMQERFTRHLTFLSIDVVSSTELKKGVPEADLLYTFGEYHNFVKQIVMKVGGKIISTSGDGIMAEFSSEQPGVNAAADILEGMKAFNRERNLLGKPVVLRMGINAGKVLVDDKDQDGKIFSMAIDIAGHLQKLAKSGQLLVSQDVCSKLENASDFEEYPGKYPVKVLRYKYSLDTPESQAVHLEVKLVIDPIRGRSVSELQPADEIFVYFSNRTESNKKYMDALGIKDAKRRESIKTTVVETSRTDVGSYKVIVKMREDIYGVDIVGTNQRIKVLARTPTANQQVVELSWWEKIIRFFQEMCR